MGTADRKIAGIVFFKEPSRVYRLVRTLISLGFHYCSMTMSTGLTPIGRLLSSHSNEPNLTCAMRRVCCCDAELRAVCILLKYFSASGELQVAT